MVGNKNLLRFFPLLLKKKLENNYLPLGSTLSDNFST